MSIWQDDNGTTVETITLSLTGKPGGDGDWYLVKAHQNGTIAYLGQVRTVAELVKLGVDLKTLEQK